MNDSSIISGLFSKYGAEIKRYIKRKFHDTYDAEDIVQDAFFNFLKIDDLTQIDNPRAYLYQSAHNLALNRFRRKGRHDKYVEQADIDEEDIRSPERYASATKDLEAVCEGLDNLPPKARQAFILSRVEHKSYSEIAGELGVSVSSVEKYLMTALAYLRDSFEDD